MRILMKILWFCSAFIHFALSRHFPVSHSTFPISISCYCTATIELCALQVVVAVVVAAICIIVIAIVVLAFINVKT